MCQWVGGRVVMVDVQGWQYKSSVAGVCVCGCVCVSVCARACQCVCARVHVGVSRVHVPIYLRLCRPVFRQLGQVGSRDTCDPHYRGVHVVRVSRPGLVSKQLHQLLIRWLLLRHRPWWWVGSAQIWPQERRSVGVAGMVGAR